MNIDKNQIRDFIAELDRLNEELIGVNDNQIPEIVKKVESFLREQSDLIRICSSDDEVRKRLVLTSDRINQFTGSQIEGVASFAKTLALNILKLAEPIAVEGAVNVGALSTIRLAEPRDYPSIHEIWMQDHVIKWMSFSPMTLEAFKPLYEKFSKESKIYVMEDGSGKIVAVRRLAFGTDPHNQHIAGFYSFGVHRDHLNKGYGKRFYDEFIALVKNHNPPITRIEFTQSYSNDAAFHLSDKFGFEVEARFPEWLYRTTENKGQYNLPERFVYKLLDDSVRDNIQNPEMKFQTRLPEFRPQQGIDFRIEQEGNVFQCYDSSNKLHGTCTFMPRGRVISHILFWSVSLEAGADPVLMTQSLREIIVQAQKEGYKKIEITSHDSRILPILSQLGFHYRGEKQASIKLEDGYYNEVCADFSFFNIEDAKKLLPISNRPSLNLILEALTTCESAIKESLLAGEIDAYMASYLENLAFQITRENLSDYKLYTPQDAPWNNSIKIDELPRELNGAFKLLISQCVK